jgi:hypothetical protein
LEVSFSGTDGIQTWVEILEGLGEIQREFAKFWEKRVKAILIYLVRHFSLAI